MLGHFTGRLLSREPERLMEAIFEYEQVLRLNPRHPQALQGHEALTKVLKRKRAEAEAAAAVADATNAAG